MAGNVSPGDRRPLMARLDRMLLRALSRLSRSSRSSLAKLAFDHLDHRKEKEENVAVVELKLVEFHSLREVERFMPPLV